MFLSASVCAAYKLAIFVIEMARYTDINPRCKPYPAQIHSHPPGTKTMSPGLQYEMSDLIPPQFDTYGRTFWIPSQVEPTVALIGASLPAIRQSLISLTSKVWSQVSFKSATHTMKQGSNDNGAAVRRTSQRSRPLIVLEPKLRSAGNESETALYTECI